MKQNQFLYQKLFLWRCCSIQQSWQRQPVSVKSLWNMISPKKQNAGEKRYYLCFNFSMVFGSRYRTPAIGEWLIVLKRCKHIGGVLGEFHVKLRRLAWVHMNNFTARLLVTFESYIYILKGNIESYLQRWFELSHWSHLAITWASLSLDSIGH